MEKRVFKQDKPALVLIYMIINVYFCWGMVGHVCVFGNQDEYVILRCITSKEQNDAQDVSWRGFTTRRGVVGWSVGLQSLPPNIKTPQT